MAKAQSSIEARFAEAVELHRADRLAEARAAYLAILQDDPERVACYNNLGAIAVRQKDAPVADTMLRKAIELDPKNFDAFNNLGNLYANIGQREAAIAFYRSALDIDPGYLPARINLANELQATGQFPQALNEYGAALAANPLLVEAHSGLGTLLLTTADPREATPCFMRAAVIQPGWTAAWNNLGGAMLQMSLLEQAARCLNRALILAGDFPNALLNLGNMMTSLGRTEDATHLYERILAIQPDHGPAISNLLLALNYADGLDADALAERHKRLGARLDEAASHAPALMRPSPAPRAGRIRIGYVSPDLRTHSVAYFFEPLLREHDRTRFEIFCYAELFSPDDMSRRLEAMADHWIPTVGLSDRALAERIVADGIDILVDLAGHSAYNRLAVFALRPAAIQVSWLGYPNTTGLSSIDYRLVDQISDPPPESDRLASEKLVRLEGGFHCYLPPADAPPVSAPPSAETGRITFGSFNNIAKLSDSTLSAWATLLQRVEGSTLLIKSRFFGEGSSRERFLRRLDAAGIPRERLTLLEGIPAMSDHLAAYGRVDVSLDSFPYNGTTTLCESLWMGVPVVTLRGADHRSRVGASLLTHIGLPELVADTVEAYVDIATSLVADPGRLAALRAGLRERVAASPIGDPKGFARKIEKSFDAMLRDVSRASEGCIVVDGVFFQLNQTGIARVWAELLRRWGKRDFGKRIVLLDRGGLPEDLPGLLTTIPFPPLSDWREERPRLQALCDQHKAVLFLSTYYTRPSHTPSLQLMYDMIPERTGIDLSIPMWVEKHEAIRHASAFICISQNTLADLHHFFPESAAKPSAVANVGISPSFQPPSEETRTQFHEVFVKPNLDGRRYILFVGDTQGYKNGQILVEALSQIDCTDLAVLFTRLFQRAEDNEVIAQLKRIPGLIIHQQPLSDMGLQLAYGNAHCLVFPSYYEGFGLPIAEAMACGCPVICSGTSSMPEVAGDAAILIDPSQPEELVAALRQLEDPQTRRILIERGLQRARLFSWDRFADQMESFVMEQLAGPSVGPHCRLCNGQTRAWGRKTLLGRHDVAYAVCDNCGSLQTEPPYWLDEAYSRHTTGLDTGACQRCFDLVQETTVLLTLLDFPKDAKAVDFGSGTGLYARMMRDRGYDFFAQDKYVKPYYMDGFSVEAINTNKFRLITGFEVIEHFPNPTTDIANLFGAGAALVLISTSPFAGQDESWEYLSPESGQHVFFYSLQALGSIANAYGYRAWQVRQTFAFFSETYVAELAARGIEIEAILAQMRDASTFLPKAMELLGTHLQAPYHYATIDSQSLARVWAASGSEE
jgi:glycosyltransferase involved in cell wall biosynthesis/tetratricopeptide (TPR) repeat protein